MSQHKTPEIDIGSDLALELFIRAMSSALAKLPFLTAARLSFDAAQAFSQVGGQRLSEAMRQAEAD